MKNLKNKKGKQQEKQAPKNSHTFINLHKYQSTLLYDFPSNNHLDETYL